MGFNIGLAIGLIVLIVIAWQWIVEFFLILSPVILIGIISLIFPFHFPFAITNYQNLNWLLSIISLAIPLYASYMITIKLIPRLFGRESIAMTTFSSSDQMEHFLIFITPLIFGFFGFLIEIFLKWLFAR